MKSKNKNTSVKKKAAKPSTAAAVKSGLPKPGFTIKPLWIKLLLAALVYVFCTWVYGDVFVRAQQEAFVTANAEQMKYVLDQPFGNIYWVGRFILSVYHYPLLGGLVLTLVLTGIACQVDCIFRTKSAWRGAAFVLPMLVLAALVACGTNLWYKGEPSRIMLWPIGMLLVLLCVTIPLRIYRRWRKVPAVSKEPVSLRRAYGLWIGLAGFATVCFYGGYVHQTDRIIASQQNRLWNQDWEGMIEDGLACRRPTRVVAAYYAIGCLRQGELLDRLFDLPFNYPLPDLKHFDGNEEYGLLQVDADFEAGLVQPAYHYALEFTVMYGPTIRNIKRMAVCTLLMGQKEHCQKYLTILSRVPFEGAFVEKYSAMLNNPKLIDEDEELAGIKKLAPRESHFEQNYRQPIFLGYNIGLLEGSDETLETSIAACLYGKNLDALMPRLDIQRQRGQTLHPIAQQAIVCYAIKHPDVLKYFNVNPVMQSELRSFMMEAKEYQKDKDLLREKLRTNWLGSYYYYYYCENNDSIATGKVNPYSSSNSGVN